MEVLIHVETVCSLPKVKKKSTTRALKSRDPEEQSRDLTDDRIPFSDRLTTVLTTGNTRVITKELFFALSRAG